MIVNHLYYYVILVQIFVVGGKFIMFIPIFNYNNNNNIRSILLIIKFQKSSSHNASIYALTLFEFRELKNLLTRFFALNFLNIFHISYIISCEILHENSYFIFIYQLFPFIFLT